MMARGLVPEETKHNGHRRAHFHDYNRPGVYMLTLVTEGRQRLFGSIVGHTREQRGTEEYPHLQCSALGAKILQEEIAKIPYYYKGGGDEGGIDARPYPPVGECQGETA